ncbi:MAG: hypothetical protein JWM11_4019 [Planctomycetaceae bacterium]|nr:hypothetical protein [Planctomycetaceae bacterium]
MSVLQPRDIVAWLEVPTVIVLLILVGTQIGFPHFVAGGQF